MRTFLKSLKRQDGFTLVELMVVVAIIGLLSAVAVPNFKKYQAKAKISEAKLQLSAAYTAQTAFFSDYNIYHHCLTYMGFDPGPESANRYYAVGFVSGAAITASAYTAAVNSGLNSTTVTGCPNVAFSAATHIGATGDVSNNHAGWFPAGKGVGSAIASTHAYLTPITTATLGTQADTDTMTFAIGAAGVISGSGATAATASRLQIDQAKIIRNLQNGF